MLFRAQGRLLKRGVKFVIHVLGPDSRDPEFERTLSDAIWNALQRADHLNVQAVAFPAIGSGKVMLKFPPISKFFKSNLTASLRSIVLKLYHILIPGIESC